MLPVVILVFPKSATLSIVPLAIKTFSNASTTVRGLLVSIVPLAAANSVNVPPVDSYQTSLFATVTYFFEKVLSAKLAPAPTDGWSSESNVGEL